MAFLSLVSVKRGNIRPADDKLFSISISRFKLPRLDILKTHSVFKSEGLNYTAYTH